MNARCVDCGNPDGRPFRLAYGDDSINLTLCTACVAPAMLSITALFDTHDEQLFDKAIARLERKHRDGTANDNDLTDLVRYRRLREDAKMRHPSGRTL
jgi:hypothetical protein